jgi:hypothetical protein
LAAKVDPKIAVMRELVYAFSEKREVEFTPSSLNKAELAGNSKFNAGEGTHKADIRLERGHGSVRYRWKTEDRKSIVKLTYFSTACGNEKMSQAVFQSDAHKPGLLSLTHLL